MVSMAGSGGPTTGSGGEGAGSVACRWGGGLADSARRGAAAVAPDVGKEVAGAAASWGYALGTTRRFQRVRALHGRRDSHLRGVEVAQTGSSSALSIRAASHDLEASWWCSRDGRCGE